SSSLISSMPISSSDSSRPWIFSGLLASSGKKSLTWSKVRNPRRLPSSRSVLRPSSSFSIQKPPSTHGTTGQDALGLIRDRPLRHQSNEFHVQGTVRFRFRGLIHLTHGVLDGPHSLPA